MGEDSRWDERIYGVFVWTGTTVGVTPPFVRASSLEEVLCLRPQNNEAEKNSTLKMSQMDGST